MKRIIAVLLSLMLILIPMSITASAAAINDDEQRIIDCLSQKAEINGKKFIVPKNYVTQAENFLKTIDATKAQADEIIACVEETIKILKASKLTKTSDLKVLPYEDKAQILALGKQAAAAVGGVLVYDGELVIVTNAEGETVFSDAPIVKTTGAQLDYTSVAAFAAVVVLVLATSFVVARKKGLFVK